LFWLLSGVAGTYASIYSVPPPYDIGSGASQAIMGLAGAAIVVIRRDPAHPRWLRGVLMVTLGIAAALDLVSSYTLKAGHVVGFLVGLLLAIGLVPQGDSASDEIQNGSCTANNKNLEKNSPNNNATTAT
jgi:rhomboid protease GluP